MTSEAEFLKTTKPCARCGKGLKPIHIREVDGEVRHVDWHCPACGFTHTSFFKPQKKEKESEAVKS